MPICNVKLTINILTHILNIPLVKLLDKHTKASGDIIIKNITVTYLTEKLIRIDTLPKDIIPFIIPSKLTRSVLIIFSILIILSFKFSNVTFLLIRSEAYVSMLSPNIPNIFNISSHI